MSRSISVKTSSRTQFVDITSDVEKFLDGERSGICVVYVPHTTAGVTINENADPSVRSDIINVLEKLVPWNAGYRHLEGNAAAHVKASMMGSSVTIPITEGKLALGTWQGVYFCEFDGPRSRKVYVTVIEG